MSFFKGRETSKLSLNPEQKELLIKDKASFFRMMQMFMIVIWPFIFIRSLVAYNPPFWLSLLSGALVALVLYCLYYYAFKMVVSKNILVSNIDEILLVELLNGANRVAIKLKNGTYRNLIANNQDDIKALLQFFGDMNISINHRSNFSFLPLNY